MDDIIQVGDLIGAPFARGGRDLIQGVDCFGVLLEAHRRQGKQVPDFRSPALHHEMAQELLKHRKSWVCHWEKTEEGVFVPLSVCTPGRSLLMMIEGMACHVGFVHRPGWFIHAWEGTKSVVQERVSLWQKRIFGVYEFDG